ncbi:hypothetical protein LPJ57_006917 [Coemansia sp. RSA 486]|nr:hypothetical protein LPJ57_006917 [Coemansia sp. RSA 486]
MDALSGECMLGARKPSPLLFPAASRRVLGDSLDSVVCEDADAGADGWRLEPMPKRPKLRFEPPSLVLSGGFGWLFSELLLLLLLSDLETAGDFSLMTVPRDACLPEAASMRESI